MIQSFVFTLIGLASIIVGALLILELNETLLKTIIAIVIVGSLPFFFYKKELGTKKINTSNLKKIIGYILFFIVSVLSVIVGAGGATALLMIMVYFFGYKMVEGYASITIPEFFLALIPAIIFFLYGYLDITASVVIFLGGLVGGVMGAKTAIKKGDKWLKSILGMVILASVIKIIFF